MVTILPGNPHRDRQSHAAFRPGTRHPAALTALFDQLDLSELDRMTIGDLIRHGPDAHDAWLGAVLGLLFAARAEGSLCLCLDPDRLHAHTRKTVAAVGADGVAGFMRRLEHGFYDRLIDRSAGGDFLPLVLDDTTGRRLLYFQKFHYHEQRLKRRLQALLSAPHQVSSSDAAIAAVIEALYSPGAVIRTGPDRIPVVRDPDQVDAIRAALTLPLLIVSGGPGTGKTSLLANLLRALARTGTDPARILLAAPTGRAAQRMTEALAANLASIAEPDSADRSLMQVSGSTIHKLLVYRGTSGDFLYGEARPVAADVMVVDEVSMVDVVMMDRLLSAVEPGRTRVILMGDKDQLPSVEAGSVLADMSLAVGGGSAAHMVVLRQTYRSTGPLLELARAINAGRPVALRPMAFERALNLEAGQWAFVAAGDGSEMQRCLDRWAGHHFLRPQAGDAMSYVDLVGQLSRSDGRPDDRDADPPARLLQQLFTWAFRSRILTVQRRGPTGAGWVNQRIAAGLRQLLDPAGDPGSALFHGAVIMITRNDYARDLFNGDLGVVLRHAREGGYRVYFRRSGGVATFPAAALSDWEPAFAITVHKSQGSEFQDALLVLPERSDHRLLTREILYTAATRASRRLVVYGTQAAFQTALERKIERQSGLTG